MTRQDDNRRHKQLQRERDRILGWKEVTVKVAREYEAEIRRLAANMPGPRPLSDPRQLDMIAHIEAQIAGDAPDTSGAQADKDLFD